jgi:hypothetical protein
MSSTAAKVFVGMRSVQSSDQLKSLLQDLPAQSRCYFLRWVHKVSGFSDSLPTEFPSPRGEMLTPEFEVRWQQTNQGYNLLLLAHREPESDHKFQALDKRWLVSDPLDVHPLPKGKPQDTEAKRQDTRWPQPLIYPDELRLQQRYFQDEQTGTTHFVALTLVAKVEKTA